MQQERYDLDLMKFIERDSHHPDEIAGRIKAVNGLHSRVLDMREAYAAIEFIEGFDGSYFTRNVSNVIVDIRPHLIKSAIVLYARCFNSSTNRNSKGLLKIVNSDQELKPVHEEIMQLRDKSVAHYGDSNNHIDLSLLSIMKTSKNEELPDVSVRHPYQRKMFDRNLIPKFKKLVEFVHNHWDNQLREQSEDLKAKLLEFKTVEQWLEIYPDFKVDSILPQVRDGLGIK